MKTICFPSGENDGAIAGSLPVVIWRTVPPVVWTRNSWVSADPLGWAAKTIQRGADAAHGAALLDATAPATDTATTKLAAIIRRRTLMDRTNNTYGSA